jgi:hypothetical protein
MDRAMKSPGGKYSVLPAHGNLQYLFRVSNRTQRPDARSSCGVCDSSYSHPPCRIIPCRPGDGARSRGNAGGERRLEQIAPGRGFPIEHLPGDEV